MNENLKGLVAMVVVSSVIITTGSVISLNTEQKNHLESRVLLDEAKEELFDATEELNSLNKSLENKEDEVKNKDKIIKDQESELKKLKEENDRLRRSPLPEIINRGGFNGYSKKANFVSTFYFPLDPGASSMEHDGDVNSTATGRTPGPTVFAVDPKVIPLGSKMRVTYPSGKVVVGVAGDTGGAIKGNIIDTFVYTKSEGNRRGRENVIVEW